MLDPIAKSASNWTLADLEYLVATERPEGVTLEIKRDLPLADGAIGWRAKRKLHSSERDGLAREVVALANSYGGAIVVGIDEASDAPSRAFALAEPLPAIFELVDRLRSSFASVIDPPVSGLDISAISAAGNDGSGFLAITVPASSQRPHGVGSPPQVFTRRDERADPATMQEIHGMFWEARTNRDRIAAELERSASQLEEFTPQGEIVFQFVAVSERPLQLLHLRQAMRSGQILKNLGMSHLWEPASAAEFPGNSFGWTPTATGVEFRNEPHGHAGGLRHASLWEVDDTGVLTVSGSNNLREADFSDVKRLYPGWYSKTCGQLLGLLRCLSRWANYDGDWVLSGRVFGLSRVHAWNGDQFGGGSLLDLSRMRAIRGLRVSNRPDNSELSAISERIWAMYGLSMPENDKAIENGIAEAMQYSAS